MPQAAALAQTPAVSLSPFAPLGFDAAEVADTRVVVSGRLPDALEGVLFRNGPGLFNRGGKTKRTLLDGDGMIQRLQIGSGSARYARRFVATPKKAREEAADRFLFPTWTSTAPGLFSNIGQHMESQAGVTAYCLGDTLYALDEVAPGFALDPETLATRGPLALGLPEADKAMNAHARQLADSGDWLFASTRMGREGMKIDVVRRRRDGSLVKTPTVAAPRVTYVHDFVATEQYALFVLHAAQVHGLRYMFGLASFTECLEWRPELGNIVLLVDLETGALRVFDAPAAWVWHLANGYLETGCFIADFVGYDQPGHFLGAGAQLEAIMQGRVGNPGSHGTLRRYVIDLARGTLAEQIIDAGNFDFCSADNRRSGQLHRRVFATCGAGGGILHSGIAAIDTATGIRDAFDFGAHVNAGEPVFAADPNRGEEAGWLISQTYDSRTDRSAFAVFDALAVGAGPLATIALPARMSMSFHGHWNPR